MGTTKDYLDNEQLRLEKISEDYRKDANRNMGEFSKHLILTSSIFIALSSSILGINDVFRKLLVPEKWAFVSGMGLMILSILFGLIQYIVDYFFFKRQIESKNTLINLIFNNNFKTTDDYLIYLRKESLKIKLESSNMPLIFQSFFILSGIGVFIFVIYRLIF